MHDDDQRLGRLRALAARLERLPESAHRDWMLVEVRARLVDIDTGYPPRPLRPLRESEPAAESARAATPRTKRPPTIRPQPAPDTRVQPRAAPPGPLRPADEPVEQRAVERRGGDDEATSLLTDADQVLWLEDAEEDPAAPDPPRWRRGLRG